jgi:general secretion pathway protein B
MSYILEALKKSEYARQQGRVPDLATLPAAEAPPDLPFAANRLPLLAGGALLLAVAVTGWWRPWQSPPPVEPPAGTTSAPAVQTLVAAPPPSAPAAQPQPQPQPAIAPAAEPLPAPAQVALPAQPAPAPRAVLPAQEPTPIAARPLPAAPLPAQPAPATALPTPPNRVLAFYELPPTVRERIPPLSVSGFSYAEQPDLRMAVINDKVLRQGESAAPGITLERIASDGVVLSFSGYRFRPQR